ncbi:MAG: mandelate racemase/muconate lactonizing enzyme family protein [Acidimicrobiales bacterium]
MHATIVGIDVFGYSVGYAHGEYVMSGGRAASRQTGTLVRLTSDTGHVGWGEITPLGATYLPTFTEDVRAAVAFMAPDLLGADPTNISAINRLMDSLMIGQSYAKSPIDIACWDLKGQILNVPVSLLLGGLLQDSYAIYEPVPLRDPEDMGRYITERRALGVNRFQLKVGNEPSIDIERCAACVEAGDSETIISADANGGWSLAQARVVVRGIRDLPIFLEQPCRTTEDCVLATRHCDLPLILDESIVRLEDLFLAKNVAGAVAINVKISRVGGLTKAALFRDTMQELNLDLGIEDMWGGDVISAAVSHIAASTRPESLLLTPLLNELTSDGFIAGHTPRMVDGRGSAPTAPGLGIVVDTTTLGEPLLSLRLGG